ATGNHDCVSRTSDGPAHSSRGWVESKRHKRSQGWQMIQGERLERGVLPELAATLWRCDVCHCFVCIHSEKIVAAAVCPSCPDVQLRFCGTFESILGLRTEPVN